MTDTPKERRTGHSRLRYDKKLRTIVNDAPSDTPSNQSARTGEGHTAGPNYKELFEKAARINVMLWDALAECQLALCPDFKTCAEALKDGQRCACGFEDGPYANAVPKNRAAAAAVKVLAGLNARIDAATNGMIPVFDGIAELATAIAKATAIEGTPGTDK